MNILNKSGEDHENFIKAYDLFANYIDDETKVKKIDINTLYLQDQMILVQHLKCPEN